MATITPTNVDTSNTPNVKRHQWAFTAGDTGVAIDLLGWVNVSVSAIGTYNGATILIEQSDDNVTFVTAVDPQANAISKTADFIETLLDTVRYIRPRVSAGSVTAVTITLTATKRA